jgi:Fe-S oxidoreductase
MAKMKIEFRAAYAQEHGIALRDKLIAYLPRYAPTAARLRWLLNLRNRVPVLAMLVEKLCGFSARRALPYWRLPFSAAAQMSAVPRCEGKEVLLFIDTFNNYMEPDNAQAAQHVLEALGYTVHLSCAQGKGSRPLCCGRTFLAAGLVDEAKAEAKRSLDALLPFVERGVAVVGLEPSCLLTMRDEFLHYGYGKAASRLSESAYLLEEFLVRENAAGGIAPAFKPLPYKRALLHGHCHQKAFDAVTPILQVLNWIPELNTELIESSCCGMAGSFGYEAEHVDASLHMAELSLFPRIRNSDNNTLLIADGISCRHQIHGGLGRQSLHIAKVLDMALA